MNKRDIGFDAEKYISNYLASKDFNIVTRNYYVYGIGEIDIIAIKENVIYFFEVRARNDDYLGISEESVKNSKFFKIRKTATIFMKEYQKFASYKKKFIFVSLMRTKTRQLIKFYDL